MESKKNTNNNQFRRGKLKILGFLIPRHYRTIVRKVARNRQNKTQKKHWKLSLTVHVCKPMDLGGRKISKLKPIKDI